MQLLMKKKYNARKAVVIVETIKSLITETFPNLTIHSLKQFKSGKAGEIFLANDEIIFKIPLESDTSDSSLALEYKALTALQGKFTIAIPKPLYFGVLPDGREILGESLVPGEQFSQEAYESLTQDEKDGIFMQMGEIFHQFHTADVQEIPGAMVFGNAPNLAYFHENYTDVVKKELTPAERVLLEGIADEFINAVTKDPVPLVLNHGDLHFWNLNYDPATKKLCGLLDFGLVSYNDPLNDMCYFWNDTVEIMLRNYPTGVGENAGIRHLFYNLCNLIEEARVECLAGESRAFIGYLKDAMRQERLSV